ncbi:MAG TPA: HAD-IIIA family hydrolase [Methylomirabilota bacterium]
MRAAVFLDRDGVIIENRADYVKSWGEVRFLPGAVGALRRLGRTGHAVVLVTNQSAVGRKIITLDEAREINQRVVTEIEAAGGRVDAAYLCPHHPDDRCECRKPAPGMFLQAARELDLDLAGSYAIGDATTDMDAARSAGVRGILVLTGRGREQRTSLAAGDDLACVEDLSAAVDYVLGRTGARS